MDRHFVQFAPSTGRRRSLSDPLAAALQPPPNETPEQRQIRLQAEEDARKRSDRIDKMLKESHKAQQRKQVVKILLLGQSESGKSTTLKRELSGAMWTRVVFGRWQFTTASSFNSNPRIPARQLIVRG